MRKLIAVGVLVGGLLAGAGWGQQAQAAITYLAPQGGIGDPLTLAASGVLIPFITGGPVGTTALVEVMSPVGFNDIPPVHLVFYNNTCTRGQDVEIPVTENGFFAYDPIGSVPGGGNGLVAIASLFFDANGATNHHRLGPLRNPIHSRVYEFNPSDGRSRVFEPITIDTAEFGVPAGYAEHLWNPLRTAATFFAPPEDLAFSNGTVHSELTLICPRTSIQGDGDAAFGEDTEALQAAPGLSFTGFPLIFPGFWKVTAGVLQPIIGDIYDDDEHHIGSINFTCDCLTPDVKMIVLSPAGTYSSAAAANGTFTEISVNPLGVIPTANATGSFTGYKASFTQGNGVNNFFGRLSNGNRDSMNGVVTNAR